MNLFKKIGVAILSMAMAIGVGVAVGTKTEARIAKADTASITISTLGWGSSSQNAFGEENAEAIDANTAFYFGGGGNAGKYYTTSPAGARMYQTGSDTITVKALNGAKLTSVTFTYNNKNDGCLHTSTDTGVTAAYPSGSAVALSNVDSVTAHIANTGTTTNGQVAIASISVNYAAGAAFGTLSSISIKTAATKTLFATGDSFSAAGLVLTATDTASVTKDVAYNAAGVSFSGYNMSSAGVQTVTVSYTLDAVTKTTTYSITIANKVTYTISSTTALSNPTALTGLTASFSTTYTDKNQLTSGKAQTFTLTPSSHSITIKAIVLSMKSNASGGSGKVSYTFDGKTNYLVGGESTNVAFNNAAFYGAWSTSYVDVKVGDSLTIDVKKALTINVNASANSLFVENYQLYYFSGEQSVTPSKETVTLAADGSSTDTVAFVDWNIAETVVYSATSGNTTDLPNANLSFSGKVLTVTAGSNANAGITVTVKCQKSGDASTYRTTEITVILTAADRNITGLTITTEPSTKEFLEGDDFAVTGLVVTCTFDAAPLSVTYNAASGNLGDLTYEIGVTELTIGSTIPGGAGTGSKTITVSLEVGNNVEFDEYTIEINAKTYSTLVTNVNRLYDGQKVWLSSAGTTGDTVLAAKHSGANNISGVASSITASGICNEIAERAGAYAYIMNKVVISSTTYYYFSFDVSGTTYYLKDTGTGSNNYLGRVSSLDDACYWIISVTGAGVATITNKSNTKTPTMKYNGTNLIFSCYSSGQAAFYLYAAKAYSVANAAQGFVDNKMHMDSNVSNQCNTYYPLAKASWNALSEDERLEVAVEHAEAYERLEAWAAAKGDKISDSDMSLVTKSATNFMPFANDIGDGSAVLIIIVISSITLATVGGYFLIRRRKEN